MKIIPILCLTDNFSYLIVCEETGAAAVVDPSEAKPVQEAVAKEGCDLVAILNTHHHWDHVGGNGELIKQNPALKVYAHSSDKGRVEGLSEELDHDSVFSMGKIEFRALHNPGHTSGGLSYYAEDSVFTGDTMFAGGCGRLFEGTPEMMYHSLNHVLGTLPMETKIYFGHEYTETNLRFAISVEPSNKEAEKKLEEVREKRIHGIFTTPSTLKEEKATNPFLRCESNAIAEMLKKSDPKAELTMVSVFSQLRAMKDRF